MKTQHTPGKWMITDRPGFEEITVGTEKMDVCTVLCIDITPEEAEANARLIAQAPTLLEACKELRQFIIDNIDRLPNSEKQRFNGLVAINKALGI